MSAALFRSVPGYLTAMFVCGISISAAHAQTTKATGVTSIFAEQLSRDRLGTIKNINPQSEAMGYVASDGHFVVTSINTDIWIAPGKYVEMHPNLVIPGFTPAALTVFEDGQRTQTFSLEKDGGIPFLRLDPPTGQINRKRVQIAMYDSAAHAHTIQQCILRSHLIAPATSLQTKMQGETCELIVADRSQFSGLDLYLNEMYLGRMVDQAGSAQIDARRLPPGHYTCRMIAQTSDGVILPFTQTNVEIAPRYTLATSHDTAIVISSPLDSASIPLQVSRHVDNGIVKTRVYVDGEFVKENAASVFMTDVSLKDVPSGKTTIDVIGVAEDGTTYPVESLPIEVKNELWEQRVLPTPEYDMMKEKLAEIAEDQRQVELWFERFAHEPFSRVVWQDRITTSHTDRYTGQVVIDRYVNDIYAPGKALEYKRNATKYLAAMAKARLEAGRLYVKLKMKQQARSMFRQALQEVGETSPIGAAARMELQALTNPGV